MEGVEDMATKTDETVVIGEEKDNGNAELAITHVPSTSESIDQKQQSIPAREEEDFIIFHTVSYLVSSKLKLLIQLTH